MVDQFSQSLSLLQRLKSENKVFISFVPPFDITFEIDKKVLSNYLKDLNLAAKDFERTSDRISSLLLAILQKETEEFIKGYLKGKELEGEEAKSKDETLRKELNHVASALVDDHLKQRYDLKASSKAPTFTSIDWDIKVKIKDAQIENIEPFPYATCRILYQREYTSSYTAFLGGRSFDSIQINFSLDEIEYLMKVFQAIKQSLKEAEQSSRTK